MCGIVGVLDPTAGRRTEVATALVSAMADAMVPRGPDGSGVWADAEAGIALGHRRLAILDLSEAGAQPMVSADGRYVLTYNGEIYNHGELRSALGPLRGHSDTEVLLEHLARFGVDATLEAAEGMFAFGLWDRQDRRLTVARDRIGEKPLYYGRLGGEFVFASTLAPLRRHPAFEGGIDRDALCALLRYKAIPAPWTIHPGIRKLRPGRYLTVEGSSWREHVYWDLPRVWERAASDPLQTDPVEVARELEVLLRSSIERRLDADVPVGAFLSGGIDSSTVVAVAQQVSSHPVRTFTIGFAESGFDESEDAAKVAAHLGTEHTSLTLTSADALATIPRLSGVYDEPFADSSQIPTLLVSELARRDVTVALSGDGGDELFAGYHRHHWLPGVDDRMTGVPAPVRDAASRALGAVPPAAWDRAAALLPARVRPRQAGLKAAKLAATLSERDLFGRYLSAVSHWPDPESVVIDGREPGLPLTDPLQHPRVDDPVARLCGLDLLWYLPDDILTKVDRASMAVSLEGRIPLLDRRIIEFAAAVPTSVKLEGGRTKAPLRRVLEGHVPAAMFERPKSGFGIPLAAWLRGPLRDWAGDLLSGDTSRSLFRAEVVDAMWADHQRGTADHAYRLWDLVVAAAWAEATGTTAG